MNIKLLWNVSKTLFTSKYWTPINLLEFFSFTIKLAIIIPGLLFGMQWWWLYIFALISSVTLMLTSTIKTLPTIIYFNLGWSILSTAAIIKHFW